jgi:hypothetical protein
MPDNFTRQFIGHNSSSVCLETVPKGVKHQVAVLRHMFVNVNIQKVRHFLAAILFCMNVGEKVTIASGTSPIDELIEL